MDIAAELEAINQQLDIIASKLRRIWPPAGSEASMSVAQAINSVEFAREHVRDAKAAATLG